MIPQNLLFGLEDITTERVYLVECREHGKKSSLAVYADDFKSFCTELEDYLEDAPTVTVSSIKPMTPQEYKAMLNWK